MDSSTFFEMSGPTGIVPPNFRGQVQQLVKAAELELNDVQAQVWLHIMSIIHNLQAIVLQETICDFLTLYYNLIIKRIVIRFYIQHFIIR